MLLQRVVFVTGLLLAAASSSAYAHKVNVFAYVEGDQVYVQGYFSDGIKAKHSEVTVYGSDGRELVKGQTDEDGAFTFSAPGQHSGLRLVLNAGLGHQATYEIPGDELADTPASTSTTDAPSAVDDQAARAAPAAHDVSAGAAPAHTPLTEAAVRKAVAEGVLPLAREISELKERRGFSDIVGGIGFIVGLLGVFAYFKARQAVGQGKKPSDGAA
jgi:nickel transport protein